MNNEPITVLPDDNVKPKRLFAKCYYDFLDCEILSGDEKILYICLKRFINVGNDKDGCYEEKGFPSLQRIKKMTGWSNYRVDSVMKALINKGLIKKKRNGLGKNNTYYITDKEDMFRVHTVEEMVELSNETEIEMYIRKIKEAGYDVQISKAKELPFAPTTVTNESSKSSVKDNNTDNKKNQEPKLHSCDYMTLEEIKVQYEYEALCIDRPRAVDIIDTIMNVLHDALNTRKVTIRVSKEDKPANVVIGRLKRLDASHVRYVVDTYCGITTSIPNGRAYILTLLYHAEDDYNHWINEKMKQYEGHL